MLDQSMLDAIVLKRRQRIAESGFNQGIPVPEGRTVPLVPFGRNPFIVCEVKRRSPSKGDIAPGLDAPAQAALYAENGIRSISVLTEHDYFGGSLADLMAVKKRFPGIAVLRKDFLLEPEDVDLSWRAGADAILLIAGILEKKTLELLYKRAQGSGMAVLVEVHGLKDIEKIKPLKPRFTGINSRNLTTFKVDKIHPLKMKKYIQWDTRLVFESGISRYEDALFAFSSGFSGILVGESVIRRPGLIGEIKTALSSGFRGEFWSRLYARFEPGRPLLKICGLTREEDVYFADDKGADILGFILAESPRMVDPRFVAGLRSTRALKVGVVIANPGKPQGTNGSGFVDGSILNLLSGGKLDAVQFHGYESPESCIDLAYPYYKALRIRCDSDIDAISAYHCPRVLLDAFSGKAYGGTGKTIAPALVMAARDKAPLWLAGGINPTNVEYVVNVFQPELIDVSSGLEDSPGLKSREKIDRFFHRIEAAVASEGIDYARIL
ncbi:MAG: bifunctional indole-3-glycerol phosphate synthase/phosphoribosylanthranilate isomerase [Spirochaetota bacterium]